MFWHLLLFPLSTCCGFLDTVSLGRNHAFRKSRIHRFSQPMFFAKKQQSQVPSHKKSKNNKSASSPKPKSSPASSSPTKKKGAGLQNSRSTPPWDVLSVKEAKKNIELEKSRRELAKQGAIYQHESKSPARVLSKSFLQDNEQRLLNWKRFNPEKTPAGMCYIGSFLGTQLPPRLGVPEIAFLGRSNVGKSSLINALSSSAKRSVEHNDQARVGKTPGATASVNLYTLVDRNQRDILGFVDLPGFGYAKLSKEVKESVQTAAENYLGKRKELMLGILLVDIRRVPNDDDRAVLAALYDMGVPILVVSTKTDKLSVNEKDKCLAIIRDELGLPDGQPLSVSSVTGEGCRDLWKIIIEACEDGVADMKRKYDENLADEAEEEGGLELPVDMQPDDSDDVSYSQGYDWIHDTAVMYEENGQASEHVDYDEDLDEEHYFSNVEIQDIPQRETIKSLRKRARRLERDGAL